MFVEVLYAVIPVFLIIGMGMIADRFQVLPPATSMVLSSYVLRVALPVLLMQILAGADLGDLMQAGFWIAMIASQLIVYGLGYLGDKLTTRRGQAPAIVTAMSCSCCNAAFLGLPIVANLLPGNREALLVAGLATVTPSIIMAIGLSHLEILKQQGEQAQGEQDGQPRNVGRIVTGAVFSNPLVIGMLTGIVLCVLGIKLWTPLDRAIGLVGATSAPCVLLALGLDIRSKLAVALRDRGRKALRQTSIALVKLVVHPLLAWGIMLAFGVTGMWLAIGVIMASTATAVGGYVVAEVYHIVPEESALSVVLTNGLSMVTMSGFAYLFKLMGII